jgi:hypothetical protein
MFIAISTKPTILPVAVISTFLLFEWSKKIQSDTSLNRHAITHLFSLMSAVALSTAWQGIQPLWRGVGGKDYMTPWLAQPFDSLQTSVQTVILSAISPFSLLVWPPLSIPKMATISAIVSLMCWILLFAQRKLVQGELVSPRGIKFSQEFSVFSLIAAIAVPIILSVYAWFAVGSAPVQPRYYMATLILLGSLGLASTSSKWLIRIATSVLLISSSVTAWYLLLV